MSFESCVIIAIIIASFVIGSHIGNSHTSAASNGTNYSSVP